MPYEYQYYPAFKWTPEGEHILVNNVSEDHASYTDQPPGNDVKPKTKAKFSKKEMQDLLVSGNIAFEPGFSSDQLRGLLTDGLLAALKASDLSAPTGATAEELYAILAQGGVV